MNAAENPYASFSNELAARAPATERGAFLKKTYLHLAAAIYLLVAIEFAIFSLFDVAPLVQTMLGGRFSWLIVLGLFMAVNWIADSWARSDTSRAMQYAGLSLTVAAWAVLLVPILYMAQMVEGETGKSIIGTAGVITLIMFGGLTAVVFVTGKDFSFLRTALMVGGFAAMGLIVCAILFGFNLGMIFTVAMIVLMCGYILYDTSQVMLHYRTDQYVAASLALFASVALLFWYILQLVMALTGRD